MIKAIGFLTSAMLAIAGSLEGQSVENPPLGVTRDAALSQAVRQLDPGARVRVSAGLELSPLALLALPS